MITSVNKEEKKKKKKYYKEEVRREEFYHHDNNGNDAANSINCKVSQEVRCFRFFFHLLLTLHAYADRVETATAVAESSILQ